MTLSYFEEIEKQIISKISSSQSSVFVAVAWFTNQLLFDSLTDAIKNNVAVKVLILDDILNRNEFGLDFGVLSKLGADVRFARSDSGTMHNKFCIIDNMVITGSYNWTYHANKNDENILITDEESVVDSYREEFDRLFGAATPIPLPYEHLKWTDVKEGDFSELRRNIFRDVVAKNDIHKEIRKDKLLHLYKAFKIGDKKLISKVSSLPSTEKIITFEDVLTNNYSAYTNMLWNENKKGCNDAANDYYFKLRKWIFVPYEICDEYTKGCLTPYGFRYDLWGGSIKEDLCIYDKSFICQLQKYVGYKTVIDYEMLNKIPEELLVIHNAKLSYYPFPIPMWNKSNNSDRVCGINLFCIVKETDEQKFVPCEGWNPKERGEKIAREFFSASLIEQYRTITDVLTSTQIRYVGDFAYRISWDIDEEPVDVRFSSIDKWIFIPKEYGESVNHKKYVRGCLNFYKWYKRRDNMHSIMMTIDIYDDSFISGIERYLQGTMDVNRIPESLLCINLAKLSVFKLPSEIKEKDYNAFAVFCIAKEVNGNNIIYYDGWDPKTRKEEILKELRRK